MQNNQNNPSPSYLNDSVENEEETNFLDTFIKTKRSEIKDNLNSQKQDDTFVITSMNITTTNLIPALQDLQDEEQCSSNPCPSTPTSKERKMVPFIMQKQEFNIKFEGPVQISSTPNSSTIPIKTAPALQDIFRKVDLTSISKSNVENRDLNKYTQSNPDDTFAPGKLWISMSNLVKNVCQTFSNTINTYNSSNTQSDSLKRSCLESDAMESPPKRFKLTKLKCRPNIREMTPIEDHMRSFRRKRFKQFMLNSRKTYADKSTQTDFDFLPLTTK